MALRIRKDGRIFCAAHTKEEQGDTYINDKLSYEMSVVHKVIVTKPMPEHSITGEWWWAGNMPEVDDPCPNCGRELDDGKCYYCFKDGIIPEGYGE